jgi:hypothetical protein
MKNIVFAALVLILLVSGCTGLSNLFGSGSTQVNELPPDVLSVQNISVIPSSSVSTDDEFSVYFDVLNQDEANEVNTGFNIYDMGLCQFKGGEPNCKSGSSDQTGSCDYVNNPNGLGYYSPLSPEESRAVEWNFAAPSAEEIANIKVTCPIRFKFTYTYTSKSQIDVLVIDRNHLISLQKSGENPTFTPTLNVGRGPIKIYFDFGANLPVRDSSELPLYVTVQDKGTGMLNSIPKGTFTIQLPSDFQFTKKDIPASGGQGDNFGNICPYFNCQQVGDPSAPSTNPRKICTNYKDIPMVNKKSLEIRCSGIKSPTEASISNLEKTYFINSTLNYNYYLTGEVDVVVTPRLT